MSAEKKITKENPKLVEVLDVKTLARQQKEILFRELQNMGYPHPNVDTFLADGITEQQRKKFRDEESFTRTEWIRIVIDIAGTIVNDNERKELYEKIKIAKAIINKLK